MKLSFKSLLLTLSTIVIVLLACQKDFSVNNSNTNKDVYKTNITASVKGRITDENNAPVSGAVIKAGVKTTTTNINGEFTLTDAALYDKAAFITVEKAGYFTGSRTFVARNAQTHYVEVELLPKTVAGSFTASAGGTAALANGTSVTLPANAVVAQANNAAYSGNVNVAIAFIDPAGQRLSRQMPGDLRGIDEAGTEQGLKSYGMVGVELTGSNGEKLQIAAGQKATVKFPVPASLQGSAPATIALWHFNETTGLWNQEGTAVKTGNDYIAQVGHFSFWNCDQPYVNVYFSATLKDQNGDPLSYKLVRMKRITDNYFTYGFTDDQGYVAGFVPGNETLIFEVFAYPGCSTVIHAQNMGPFTSNSNAALGVVTINVPPAQQILLTGNVVNCTANAVTTGYVKVTSDWRIMYFPIDALGNFTATIPTCGGPQNVTYFAVDNTNNQQSNTITQMLNTGNNNAGTLTACGTSSVQFVNYTIDGGTPVNLLPPADSMGAHFGTQGSTFTSINFSRPSAITQNNIYGGLNFNSPATAPGTYMITEFFIRQGNVSSMLLIPGASNTPIIITEYGGINGFIAGSLSGTATEYINGVPTATTRTVQLSFRVQRQ